MMMMMMMMMILLQNVMMMMIKDEQEVTKTLDHSDTGQAHMKTWQEEWKNLLTQMLDN